jgi:integrase
VVDGKRVGRKVRAPTKQAALVRLDQLARSYRAGVSANETLDSYLRDWLADHSRSVRPSTAASYAGHVRLHIAPLLGGIRLADLGPRDVRRLVSDCERKGLSPGTIHLVIRTLSVALGAAVDDRRLADNATRGVRLPRIEREPVEPLTIADAQRIVDAVTGTWLELPVRVWLGSGLRRGEVLGLDVRDVGDDFVRVRVSKTSIRAVPVSGDAMAALRGAIGERTEGPVFLSPRGRNERMRGSSVTHALVRAVGLSPHKLRHGVATIMVAQGVHMRIVAEQLGHRNPALTARVYAHVIPQSQVEAVRALDRG